MKKRQKTALIAAFLFALSVMARPAEAKHPIKRTVRAILALPVCLVAGAAVGIVVGSFGALTGPAIWIDIVRSDAAEDAAEDARLAAQAAKDQAK
ncbi:MAG: hypothetical protein EKK48_12320 [Candidatus Melainabacteria bacterium]|nr:MAG: hypothetical protein EKK48_12320 [Candidatus Melainabacteria bacterium]